MAKNALYDKKIQSYSNLNAKTKMIFLQGASNVGKSTVLKRLIENFKKMGAVEKYASKKIADCTTTNDVIVVLQYKESIIGINTYGDYASIIEKGIKLLDTYHCDIIFGAMRTKGETVTYVDSLKKDNDICIIKKMATTYSKPLQRQIDDIQLQVLLNLV